MELFNGQHVKWPVETVSLKKWYPQWGDGISTQPSFPQISNYIAKLKGLNKLTHLAGLSSLNSHILENDHLLKITAETIPSLTHVEIHHNHCNVWALIEQNMQGEYMGYKMMRLNDDGPPAWGLFFFGIPDGFVLGL